MLTVIKLSSVLKITLKYGLWQKDHLIWSPLINWLSWRVWMVLLSIYWEKDFFVHGQYTSLVIFEYFVVKSYHQRKLMKKMFRIWASRLVFLLCSDYRLYVSIRIVSLVPFQYDLNQQGKFSSEMIHFFFSRQRTSKAKLPSNVA